MRGDFWLFPFGDVARNSDIVIYGAGLVGECYQRQIDATNYCNTLFFIDNKVTQETVLYPSIKKRTVRTPDALNNCRYDCIVIASSRHSEELIADLCRRGVAKAKIAASRGPISCYVDAPLVATPDPRNTYAWDDYYQRAEKTAKESFENVIKPILQRHPEAQYDTVLDFACGHGRIAAIFADFCENITVCDVNETALEFCRDRFKDNTSCIFEFAAAQSKGFDPIRLPFADGKFSFVYSWDAMVHFNYKWLDFYLSEFYRILKPGGHALLHHSNFGSTDDTLPKSENFSENPKWRALTTDKDVRFIAEKHGFAVVEQARTDFYGPDLDCTSLLRKN